ncbi:MAG: hypothetical protein ACLP56_01890, partial [Candidatus Sulfotelmatobacter sp.]
MTAQSASSLFIKGIRQIAKGLKNPARSRNNSNDSDLLAKTAAALMQKQAEHEERKRKISQTIANGA